MVREDANMSMKNGEGRTLMNAGRLTCSNIAGGFPLSMRSVIYGESTDIKTGG
jgi:hypothetical protein